MSSADVYAVRIIDYQLEHHTAIRRILTAIGWAEQYISAAERNADEFSQQPEIFGVYLAAHQSTVVGFLYVQFYLWNQLAQIQGLAVDPAFHRQGVATALVARAEQFARQKQARGIYVDTPLLNLRGRRFYESAGYQFGYYMPRYYEDGLDGVTFQKFFT
ncbi:MAG: GNAT family N-acetyltransferase [Anaerolineae bacterium]|nr:GNAT family N-acetyltransferase [Anaerolineae bacterium]